MAKLEVVNTLRVLFTVVVLIIIALTSGVINRYDKGLIDIVYYSGIIADIILMLSIPYIFKLIIKTTKEVKYTKE